MITKTFLTFIALTIFLICPFLSISSEIEKYENLSSAQIFKLIKQNITPAELANSNNGYLLYSGSEKKAHELVAALNEKRHEKYQKIADQNNVTLEAVEKFAAKKIQSKAKKTANNTATASNDVTKKLLSDVPVSVKNKIITNCKKQHPDDYSMQAACARIQARGWLSVN